MESEDEEEQEPSFYMAVLTQLQLYEAHSDIAERIDLNAVEQNVIKTLQPQHRTENVVENDQEKLVRFHEKIQQLDKQDPLLYVYRALRIIDALYS